MPQSRQTQPERWAIRTTPPHALGADIENRDQVSDGKDLVDSFADIAQAKAASSVPDLPVQGQEQGQTAAAEILQAGKVEAEVLPAPPRRQLEQPCADVLEVRQLAQPRHVQPDHGIPGRLLKNQALRR
jgi:hypothetical protein